MVRPKPACNFGVVAVLLCATILNGCQIQNEVTYHHNVPYLDRSLPEIRILLFRIRGPAELVRGR